MSFYTSRPLKLLIAGLYLTVVLAAGLFHTHHDCGNSHLACGPNCGSVDAVLVDAVSEVNAEVASPCCSCHCTHDHDAPKPSEIETQGKTPLPSAGDQDSRNSSLSDAHCCPICSFLAQKQLNTECPRVPVWTPLCGERDEVFTPLSITSVSFSWLSRAPPASA